MTYNVMKKKINIICGIIAIVLIAWAGFWVVYNAKTFSITSDEIVYVPSGLRAIIYGDEIMNSEHPPLNKLLSAFFVLPLKPNISVSMNANDNNQWHFGDRFWFESGNNRVVILFWGRMAMVLVMLAAMISVYLWTAKNIHPIAGLGALASLVFNPNIIAHGALTTNDALLLATVWFLFVATFKLIKKDSVANYAWWGFFLAIVMLAKFSGIFFVGFAVLSVIFFIARYRKGLYLKSFGKLILSIFICMALIYATYAYAERTSIFSHKTIEIINVLTDKKVQIRSIPKKVIYAPIVRYWEGYTVVKSHNEIGHKAYLNGDFSMDGFRWFFIANLWYKTPTAILMLIVLAGVVVFWKKRWDVAVLWLFGVVYLGIASMGKIHIGVRHILPLYVMAAPAAGYLFWQLLTDKRYAVKSIVPLLGVWLIFDLALNSPNKISYFSQSSGGWRAGYEHLSDSNTDWGQETYLLLDWQKKHSDKKLIAGYACGGDPAYSGINYTNITDIGRYTACNGLADDEVLIISVNVATGLFGSYPCISDKITKADRLGHTYLILTPEDFK